MTPKDCLHIQTNLKALRTAISDFDTARVAYLNASKSERPEYAQDVDDLRKEVKSGIRLRQTENLFEQKDRSLKEQYDFQISALFETEVIHKDSEGRFAYTDINQQERLLPTYDEFVQKIADNFKLVKTKVEQGFTNARIDLLGIPLSHLFTCVKKEIPKAKKEGRLKATDGADLDLDTANPFYIEGELIGSDTSEDLMYESESFDTQGEQGGKTKKQVLLENPTGYRIRLDEGKADLSTKEQNDGKPYNSIEYHQDLRAKEESGETIDSQILNFLINLRQRRVIDDYEGKGMINWLTGNYLKSRRVVPHWFWSRTIPRVVVSREYPGNRIGSCACRPSVLLR